ncbi:GntR family transcriptional regulator [Amycolatopsis pithecellobii]|uniref:GntR family transcriptional regulator n=1 Tax=Amycolatopsis pithecellobii TaxID=664692 RepID=UPI00140AAF37|nr:GntR family transcriptional regulator [Amycolatopsis pithecellobii]
MAPTKPTTRAARMHDLLRSAILRGELAPGEPLRLAALAAKYDASQSLVREALTRLAENNLAELSPNQGFRVVSISRSDLIAITDLRVLLEGEALRLSIEHGDVEWEAAVVSTHHVLERATFTLAGEPGTTQAWSDAHAAFHIALVSACPNPRMLALTNSLRDGAELYRQLSEGGSRFAERDIPAEHRELMRLATSRDPLAVESLERHLRRTTDDVLDSGVLAP